MTDQERLSEPKAYSRREFTSASVLALLSTVPILISGCGESSNPTTPSPSTGGGSGGASNVTGGVNANHGHIATVTSAQLTAGTDIVLDIRGAATHPHTVMISMTELAQVANGTRVSKTSSVNDAHSHVVTFN